MTLGEMYQAHHAQRGRLGFSVLEEERAKWFLQHVPQGARMLDLGCRDATLTRHFVDRCSEITGVDVDPDALRHAQAAIPNGRFLSFDLTGDWSALQGKAFDVILCSEVLEHVYFPQAVVSTLPAFLAPGGVFIGSVPNAFFLKHRMRYLLGRRRGTPMEDPTHITQFNREELERILKPLAGSVTIEGYTRPPFTQMARSMPSLFAWDLLFQVKTS